MTVSHPHGLFSWTDIALPDPEAGKRFYTALFGWDAEDQFDPHGTYVYTMFGKDGKTTAGLGPMPPGTESSGIPPMYVLSTGRPNAKASMITIGRPSAKLGSTSARELRISRRTCSPLIHPVIRTRSSIPRRRT